MSKSDKDNARQKRIDYEIVVDCYDEEEQMTGWHCYLGDNLSFPFKAKCIKERSVSPLEVGEVIKVLNMTDQDDCLQEMFVQIRFLNRTFGVPLVQLQPIDVDEKTEEAIGDWHYWMRKSYR